MTLKETASKEEDQLKDLMLPGGKPVPKKEEAPKKPLIVEMKDKPEVTLTESDTEVVLVIHVD